MTPHSIIAIRGDVEGYCLYVERRDATEPGKPLWVFRSLSAAARASAALSEAVAALSVGEPA